MAVTPFDQLTPDEQREILNAFFAFRPAKQRHLLHRLMVSHASLEFLLMQIIGSGKEFFRSCEDLMIGTRAGTIDDEMNSPVNPEDN